MAVCCLLGVALQGQKGQRYRFEVRPLCAVCAGFAVVCGVCVVSVVSVVGVVSVVSVVSAVSVVSVGAMGRGIATVTCSQTTTSPHA